MAATVASDFYFVIFPWAALRRHVEHWALTDPNELLQISRACAWLDLVWFSFGPRIGDASDYACIVSPAVAHMRYALRFSSFHELISCAADRACAVC